MTGGQLVRMGAGVVAAIIFWQAGVNMREIESISGDSIAEAFYSQVGLFSYGMAALSVLLAIPPGVSTLTRTVTAVDSTRSLPSNDVRPPSGDVPTT